MTQIMYPWVLAGMHGAALAGVWGACAGVAALGNPILLGMQNLLGPRIAHAYAERDRGGLRAVVYRWSLSFGGMFAAFALVVGLAGGYLVTLLYGEDFAGHGHVVIVLLLSLVALAAGFPLSRGLFVLDRPQLDCMVNGVGLGVFLAVGIPLSYWWGPLGAAIGLLATNGTTAGIRALVFAKHVNQEQPRPAGCIEVPKP